MKKKLGELNEYKKCIATWIDLIKLSKLASILYKKYSVTPSR